MREALAILAGARITVQATVLKFGYSHDHKPTVLLGNVTDQDGSVLADHLWILAGKRVARVSPQLGDTLQLRGVVRSYQRKGKGAVVDPTDYTLRCARQGRVIACAALAEVAAPEQLSTNASATLATIAELWQAESTPLSLGRVCNKAPIKAWQVIKSLQHLASTGRVRFSPNGCIFIVSKEGYAS